MGIYLNPGSDGFEESIRSEIYVDKTGLINTKEKFVCVSFIPNKEIIGEFENAMSTGGWAEVMHVLKASEKLLVGINYDKDSEDRAYSCVIERVEKT